MKHSGTDSKSGIPKPTSQETEIKPTQMPVLKSWTSRKGSYTPRKQKEGMRNSPNHSLKEGSHSKRLMLRRLKREAFLRG